MTLTANTAATDRAIRFALGALLLGLGAWIPYTEHWAFLVAPVVGAVLLFVAVTGYCPIFAAFGWGENTTCREG